MSDGWDGLVILYCCDTKSIARSMLKRFGLAAALSVKLAHSHLLLSAVALHISTLFASRNAVFALFCVYHPFVKVALFWQYEQ